LLRGNNLHAETPHLLTKWFKRPVYKGEESGEVFEKHLTKHLTIYFTKVAKEYVLDYGIRRNIFIISG